MPYAQTLMTSDANGTYRGVYTYGLERISERDQVAVEGVPNDPLYYLYDGRGSVTQLVNTANTVKDKYRYTPFGVPMPGGQLTPNTRLFNNPYGYNGEDYDIESGLQFLRARYYNPGTARFITRDSYLGDVMEPLSLNRYAYTSNNPLMYSDPSGHERRVEGEYYGSSSSYSSYSSQTTRSSNNQIVLGVGSKETGKVKELQTILVQLGYDLGTTGAGGNGVDGDYGDLTYNAVWDYQKKTNLKPTGEVDSITLKTLQESYNASISIGLSPKKTTIPKNSNTTSGASSNYTNKKAAESKGNSKNATGCGDGDISSGTQGTGKANNIDLSKLKPEDVTREIAEWLIGNPINATVTQHPYLTELLTGVPVKDIFYAAGFVMDGDGVYHARQEWSLQSFTYSGYNDFYDTVFHYATSMNKAKFQFNSGGEDYILWAWKGDYLNLGAGAEMGIYTRMVANGTKTNHWLVDQSLAMPMTLTLDYNGKQIISYDPKKVDPKIFDPLRKSTDKWWVTGFNPDYQDVKASQLTATYTATFNTQAMYDDFYKKYGQGIDKDSRWTFDPKTNTAKFKF